MNPKVDVEYEGRNHLDLAFRLAFERDEHVSHEAKATHYLKDPNVGFLFMWAESEDAIPLAIRTPWLIAADIAWHWLTTEAKYPEEPDTDGDCRPGWRVFTEIEGYQDAWHCPILCVAPAWIIYRK